MTCKLRQVYPYWVRMIHSFGDVLAQGVKPFFPEQFGGDRLSVSKTIAAADAPSLVMLECRLGEGDMPVDVSVGYTNRLLSFVQGQSAHRDWSDIGRFVPLWQQEAGPLDRIVMLGLEWDADAETSRPSVFFAFENHGVISSSGAQASRNGMIELVDAIEAAFQWSWSDATRHTLQRAIAAAPPGTEVPYLGVMAPRPGQPVRLGFRPNTVDAILDLIDCMSWPGERHRLTEVLDCFDCLLKRPPVLAVDIVDGRILPRLGLELITAENGQRDMENFDKLLDQMVALGLCTTEKKSGVRAWLNAETQKTSYIDAFLGTGMKMERRVSHFKLTLDKGQLSAKGYLTCLP